MSSTTSPPTIVGPRVSAVDVLAPETTNGRLGRRLGVINNKGGVGKTTLVALLGAALARKGRRVLLVDMDPQGNLTRRTAAAIGDGGSIADVLSRREKGGARAAIVRCGWDSPEAERIDVLPADLALEDRNDEAAQPGSHNRLDRVLYGVTDDYDYTLIDCRPALGHLEQNVIRALDQDNGDGVYVVVEPGADAISGAYRVIEEVAEWADDLDVDVAVLGIIVNLADMRTRLHSARVEHMPASLGDNPPPILEPYLPRAIRIAEIQDLGLPSSGDRRLEREGLLKMVDELAKAIDR